MDKAWNQQGHCSPEPATSTESLLYSILHSQTAKTVHENKFQEQKEGWIACNERA